MAPCIAVGCLPVVPGMESLIAEGITFKDLPGRPVASYCLFLLSGGSLPLRHRISLQLFAFTLLCIPGGICENSHGSALLIPYHSEMVLPLGLAGIRVYEMIPFTQKWQGVPIFPLEREIKLIQAISVILYIIHVKHLQPQLTSGQM